MKRSLCVLLLVVVSGYVFGNDKEPRLIIPLSFDLLAKRSVSGWEDASWLIPVEKSWGLSHNGAIVGKEKERILAVRYPKGSASPKCSRRYHTSLGGLQFYAFSKRIGKNCSHLRLAYWIKFSEGMDFGRGGKLPGLFGGTKITNGDKPTGNSFSTCYRWKRGGEVELYAYLPGREEKYGTSFKIKGVKFLPEIWYKLEQEVRLNNQKKEDGLIRIWINDNPVLNMKNVFFGTGNKLSIDGIFFSTHFGGGDLSWGAPKDTIIYFKDVSIQVP